MRRLGRWGRSPTCRGPAGRRPAPLPESPSFFGLDAALPGLRLRLRPALLTALAAGRLARLLAAGAAGLLAAAGRLVDGRPGPPLGLLLADPSLLVPFFNV